MSSGKRKNACAVAQWLDLGLTQREAARRIGAKTVTVESWESYGHEPTPRFWPGIFAFLGFDPYPASTTLAEKFACVRRIRGWTKRDLARHLGVDPGSITRWDRGGEVRKRRDWEALTRLFAEVLG